MSYFQVGASRMYYEVHGRPVPGVPDLVLLHGVGGNHASWFHQVTAWRERYRIVTVDARGFGNSSDVEGEGRAAFVTDLSQVLDAAAVERGVLVGQSMGGGTAVGYLCAHPDRVAGLVMADSLFGIDLPPDLAGRLRAVQAQTADLPQLERVLGASFRDRNPDMATLYAALASFNAVNLRTLKGQQTLHPLEAIISAGAPVLFLVGEEDILFPPELVEATARAAQGADCVVLNGIGHSAYFEHPQRFNQTVEGWLRTHGLAVVN